MWTVNLSNWPAETVSLIETPRSCCMLSPGDTLVIQYTDRLKRKGWTYLYIETQQVLRDHADWHKQWQRQSIRKREGFQKYMHMKAKPVSRWSKTREFEIHGRTEVNKQANKDDPNSQCSIVNYTTRQKSTTTKK